MPNHFSNRRRGFTLIEVIAGLLLIAILGAVVVSRVSSTTQATLKSNAETLKVHLRYAQLRALNSTEKVWGINFTGTNVYKLYYADTSAHDVPLPGGDGITVTLPYTTITLDGDSGRLVSFDTWGKPYQSLRANFEAAPLAQTNDLRTITLTASGSTETITIRKNTGYIP